KGGGGRGGGGRGRGWGDPARVRGDESPPAPGAARLVRLPRGGRGRAGGDRAVPARHGSRSRAGRSRTQPVGARGPARGGRPRAGFLRVVIEKPADTAAPLCRPAGSRSDWALTPSRRPR